MEPTVTIGLPLRNGSPTLRRAVESLLKQKFSDFEIVISDNASTDNSFKIASEYSEKDPRVRVIRQPLNIGPIPNFKVVLSEARGKYFLWAAHDDEWAPQYLSKLVDVLERDSETDLATGSIAFIDEDDPQAPKRTISFQEGLLDAGWLKLTLMLVSGKGSLSFLHFGLYRTAFARDTFLPLPYVAGLDWLFIIHVLMATTPRAIQETLMTRYFRSSVPSVNKYLGEPKSPGDHLFNWMVTSAACVPYLFRSRVIPKRRKFMIPLIVGRFALWQVMVEGNRMIYRAATRLLGERRRRRFASVLRRLSRAPKIESDR